MSEKKRAEKTKVAKTQPEKKKTVPPEYGHDEKGLSAAEQKSLNRHRIYMRCGVVFFMLVCLISLAGWLYQRSLQTPNKKRALQSWMDERLNADVSIQGDMIVRTNILRDSRLFLHNVEVEHPNPIFLGKFARIGRAAFWAPLWAMTHIYPGRLDALFSRAFVTVEQSDFDEWSCEGLLQPLSMGQSRFPFPMPAISDWRALVEESALTLRRRGYELRVNLNCVLSGRPSSNQVAIHGESCGFTFGKTAEESKPFFGVASPINLRFRLGEKPGDLPLLVPGRCSVRVKNLPVTALPFFIGGIPMESTSGTFQGLIRYDEHPDATGALHVDGELNDAPLSALGLPRNTPFRLVWPIGPNSDNAQANLRMGPSGFGGFEMTVSLDSEGKPKQLGMRGDIVDLDALPAVFSKYSHWPDWLTRMFPRISLRTGSWRGFDWRGENLQLSLSRSTAGMNLSGEGEMMGGRVRLSMSPEQPDSPITIAAERLDPVRLSIRLSRALPEPFRVRINGSSVNLTWRGYPSPTGKWEEWGTGMVWAKPIVDISSSGEFWRIVSGISKAIADVVPEWGGGNVREILALSREGGLPLEQLSVVSESDNDGGVGVEFRAYGDSFGQATGLVERRSDGMVEGGFVLAGPSRLLRAVEKANPELAHVLELLANESAGLRIRFTMEPDGTLTFSYPFLDDALKLREELR